MRARFIGSKPSMGFIPGEEYTIRTKCVPVKETFVKCKRAWLVVEEVNIGLYCPYENLEMMLENWELLK